MWRSVAAVTAAIFLTVALIGSVALAQTSRAALAEPQMITVAQDVPVEVVFSLPQDDGSTITVTAPITVGLNVQVTVQGPQVVDVQAAQAVEPASDEPDAGAAAETEPGTAQPSAAAGDLTDARGIPYDVQSPDGLEVQQVTSKELFGTSLQIMGQIKNVGDTERSTIIVSASLFDKDGQLIDVASGFAQASKLEPGKTTTFTAMASTQVEEVARYSVQVEALQ